MNLTIRRASLVDDREELVDILNRNFGGDQNVQLDWRHKHPAGDSFTWLMYDGKRSTAVATTSVYRRLILVGGKPTVCGQVGGFAVDVGYRSLGPAVLMQRATFAPVDDGELPMCFDCPPHDQGMATFDRLGMAASAHVFRYALLLRSNEVVEKKLGGKPWSAPVIAAANLILRARQRKSREPQIEISESAGDFDDEFSHLDAILKEPSFIRGSRSAEILNWCYRQNPVAKYRVLVARRSGELVGFLVFVVYGDRVSISDVFAGEVSASEDLVAAAVDIARSENRTLVEAYGSEGSGMERLLIYLRFRRREKAARIVAYEKPGNKTLLCPSLQWTFCFFDLLV